MRSGSNALVQAIRLCGGDEGFWLLEVRLDCFDVLRSRLSHVMIDQLVAQLALIIRSHLEGVSPFTRVADDALFLLIKAVTLEAASSFARRLHQTLGAYRPRGHEQTFELSYSIGVVRINIPNDPDDALKRVHAACSIAQREALGCFATDDPRDPVLAKYFLELADLDMLRRSLREKRIELLYQEIAPLEGPIIRSPTCAHYEILSRLIDDRGNHVPTGRFVPIAERYGLAPALDLLVLDSAFRTLAHIYGDGDGSLLESASINLSAATLHHKSLISAIEDHFAEDKIKPHQICFELTETLAVSDFPRAKRVIEDLRAMGCRFSIDDFGSGNASFATLLELSEIDFLKIDGMLIQRLDKDVTAVEMVRATVTIARSLNIKTVAEFVDRPILATIAGELGIDYAQGHLVTVARPLRELASRAKYRRLAANQRASHPEF